MARSNFPSTTLKKRRSVIRSVFQRNYGTTRLENAFAGNSLVQVRAGKPRGSAALHSHLGLSSAAPPRLIVLVDKSKQAVTSVHATIDKLKYPTVHQLHSANHPDQRNDGEDFDFDSFGLEIDYDERVMTEFPKANTQNPRVSYLSEAQIELQRLISARHRHSTRRVRQNAIWSEMVLPSIIPAYLDYDRISRSGRWDIESTANKGCTCGSLRTKTMDITLVKFSHFETRQFVVCPCRPLCPTLVQQGYFPCAPTRPSLAFDMSLLNFLDHLGFHTVPNAQAFGKTINDFHAERGFNYQTKDSVPRRLNTALLWYKLLREQVTVHVNAESSKATSQDKAIIHAFWNGSNEEETLNNSVELTGSVDPESDSSIEILLPLTSAMDGGIPPNHEGENGIHITPDINAADESRQRTASAPKPLFPEPTLGDSDKRSSPSPQLQAACRWCFGHSSTPRFKSSCISSIGSIDACFSQKRRHLSTDQHDMPLPYPNSIWISEEKVEYMRQYTEICRQKPSHVGRNAVYDRVRPSDDVLASCDESFKAANENYAKSSSRFHADTGLMAFVCRHDIPIFLVNITTPGERQFYALAIIKELYLHLPSDWVCGIMYDIGCKLEASMIRSGLLGHLLPRLVFAVSILHAYGHQWTCQIMYHPRKCEGFGCSDGEGCERVWSSLRGLIGPSRAASLHHRRFMIYHQLNRYSAVKQLRMGRLLSTKLFIARLKKRRAEQGLKATTLSRDEAWQEWQTQLVTQSKPLPAANKRETKVLINQLIVKHSLNTKDRAARTRLNNLLTSTTQLSNPATQNIKDKWIADIKVLDDRISLHLDHINRLTSRINTESLSSRDIGSKFGTQVAQMTLLRDKIFAGLVERRFEFEPLDRVLKATGSKAADHLLGSYAGRQSGIKTLITRYNNMRESAKEYSKLLPKWQNVVIPKRLNLPQLWKLDVDSEEYHDIALDWRVDGSIPRWMADPAVRQAIRSELIIRRCIEEEERIMAECDVAEATLNEERRKLEQAWLVTENSALRYQFEARLRHHAALEFSWFSYFPRKLAYNPLVSISLDQIITSTDVRRDLSVHEADACSSDDGENPLEEEGIDNEYVQQLEDKYNQPAEANQELNDEATGQTPIVPTENSVSFNISTIQFLVVPTAQTTFSHNHTADPLTVTMSSYSRQHHPATNPNSQRASSLSSVTREQRISVVNNNSITGSIMDGISDTDDKAPTIFLLTGHAQKDQAALDDAILQEIDLSFQNDDHKPPNKKKRERVQALGWFYHSIYPDETTRLQDNPKCKMNSTELDALGDWINHFGGMKPGDLDAKTFCVSSELWQAALHSYNQSKVDPESLRAKAARTAVVRKQLCKVHSPLATKQWLVPICESKHWILLVINFHKKTIEVLDSLPSGEVGMSQRVKVGLQHLLELLFDVYKMESYTAADFKWSNDSRPERQTNSYDCGVFVVADMLTICMHDTVVNHTQEDLKGFREMFCEALAGAPQFVPSAQVIPASDRFPEVSFVIDGGSISD